MARICSTAGCPAIHDGPGSRCPTHTKTARKQHWDNTKAYNTKGHRIFRMQVLDRDSICVACGIRAAVVADHYPHSRRDLIALGLNPNDPRYGRGLCESDHNKSTAQNQPGGWNNRD